MPEVSGAGPAPYIYVCTRMRVRKAKLIPREEYQRLLNMSLPEIARFIEETEYKQEIDELGTSFKGTNLIEVAVSWNLAKEYQRILQITPGNLKHFAKAYLRRWDIQNVLTIIRGKIQGVKSGKIKEVLVPAGSLDRVFLDRLVNEDSPERIVDVLKDTRIYPVFVREFQPAMESGSFARLENELYKAFYADLIAEAKSGVKGGDLFLAFIKLDIDIKNIKTLFRLRADGFDEDGRDILVPGGSFSLDELQQLNGIQQHEEFIDNLMRKVKLKSLLDLLESLKKERKVRDIEIALTRVQLEQMERMSKRTPFSIHPILVYLEKKKYEVTNLRAIARGKESNLPTEKIAECLVM